MSAARPCSFARPLRREEDLDHREIAAKQQEAGRVFESSGAAPAVEPPPHSRDPEAAAVAADDAEECASQDAAEAQSDPQQGARGETEVDDEDEEEAGGTLHVSAPLPPAMHSSLTAEGDGAQAEADHIVSNQAPPSTENSSMSEEVI